MGEGTGRYNPELQDTLSAIDGRVGNLTETTAEILAVVRGVLAIVSPDIEAENRPPLHELLAELIALQRRTLAETTANGGLLRRLVEGALPGEQGVRERNGEKAS